MLTGPLVRVKAGEVRKRLSDYYQSTPDNGFKIELPLGGYVPRIHSSGESATTALPPEGVKIDAAKPFNRRRFAWMAGGTLGILGAASLFPILHQKATPLDVFWRPVFATKAPLLIFIPVMRDKDGKLTEWVGIGPTASLRRAADFLTEHHYPYHLRFGAELTYSQLREQPSLILGGFDADWTMRMAGGLRFAPTHMDGTGERGFIDNQTKQVWKAIRNPSNPYADADREIKSPPNPYVDVDYGILCRLFDAATGQIRLLAVGTQTFGTEGAANLLFSPELFAAVVQQAPHDWETKNFQAVIRVSVIGTTTSSPQLVATHFW